MKPETLQQIKKELSRLFWASRAICLIDKKISYMGGHTTASVILNNIAFDRTDCVGYNQEEEERKLTDSVKALKLMAEASPEDHTLSYFYHQANMIVDGNVMSEDYEEEIRDTLKDYHPEMFTSEEEENVYTPDYQIENETGGIVDVIVYGNVMSEEYEEERKDSLFASIEEDENINDSSYGMEDIADSYPCNQPL